MAVTTCRLRYPKALLDLEKVLSGITERLCGAIGGTQAEIMSHIVEVLFDAYGLTLWASVGGSRSATLHVDGGFGGIVKATRITLVRANLDRLCAVGLIGDIDENFAVRDLL